MLLLLMMLLMMLLLLLMMLLLLLLLARTTCARASPVATRQSWWCRWGLDYSSLLDRWRSEAAAGLLKPAASRSRDAALTRCSCCRR
jgi:hypothetical protein